MNKNLPDRYYLQSKDDFGQHGVIFKTPYCIEIWFDLKYGKGSYKKGVDDGNLSVGIVEVIYYPCPSNPQIQGC